MKRRCIDDEYEEAKQRANEINKIRHTIVYKNDQLEIFQNSAVEEKLMDHNVRDKQSSQDSDGVPFLNDVKVKYKSPSQLLLRKPQISTGGESLKNVKLNDQLSPHSISCKIGMNTIVIMSNDNLARFLKRNPYTKHQKDSNFSKKANQLKFLDEKKTSNWYRNLFYCFKNIKAIEPFVPNINVMKFIQNPSIKTANLIFQNMEMYRSGFQKYPRGTLAIKFLNDLNMCQTQIKFTEALEGLDYVIKPIKYICKYLTEININNSSENEEIDIQMERQIMDQNAIEASTMNRSDESYCFNFDLKNRIYEIKDKDKKRNLKFYNKY